MTIWYGSQYIRSVYGVLTIYNFDVHEATVEEEKLKMMQRKSSNKRTDRQPSIFP